MNGKPEAPISTRNFANDGYLPGLLDQIMSDFLKERIDDCLPAIVQSYDAEKNLAIVQPLIMLLRTDGETVERGTLRVPVFSLGTSKMSLRFNLAAGDLGWIKANDRDISLFLQSYKEERPNTLRKHDFSDAVFYPDAMKGMAFGAGVVAMMTNADGTVKTEWYDDKIVHTAADVEFSENVTVSGQFGCNGALSQPRLSVGTAPTTLPEAITAITAIQLALVTNGIGKQP